MSIREFKPTILFLAKFIAIYVVANLVYGFYVSAYWPGPDRITSEVSRQTSIALNLYGWETHIKDSTTKPVTVLSNTNQPVLHIYEGCNGVNVMIIFVAFLVAFGPMRRAMLWFIPVGLTVIHLFNLFRVGLLYWVALYRPDFMYLLHKYFFTAVLYIVVFLLWIVWVRKSSIVKQVRTA